MQYLKSSSHVLINIWFIFKPISRALSFIYQVCTPCSDWLVWISLPGERRIQWCSQTLLDVVCRVRGKIYTTKQKRKDFSQEDIQYGRWRHQYTWCGLVNGTRRLGPHCSGKRLRRQRLENWQLLVRWSEGGNTKLTTYWQNHPSTFIYF